MLFKELDKLKRNAVMTSIILIFIGLVLLILPEEYISFLGQAVGFVLLVVFADAILNFIGSKKALIHYIHLAFGLLAGVCGIALFAFENTLISSLPWLIGVLPIIGGFYGVYHALAFARHSGRKGWWVLVILSGLLILFGVCIFFNPWKDNSYAMIKVIGGTLMFSAIVSALRLIWLWPVRNEQEGKAQ